MANVKTFKSPKDLKDYLESITLPADYWIVDKGARYVVVQDDGTVTTLFDESSLELFIDGLTDIARIVPKKAGGHFTFASPEDEVAGVQLYGMTITKDQKNLEDSLNILIDGGLTPEIIVEHSMKKVIFSTPFDPDAVAIFNNLGDITAKEQVAINTWVVAEKAAGNFAQYDHVFAPQISRNSFFGDVVAEGGQLGGNGIFTGDEGIKLGSLQSLDNYSLTDMHVSAGYVDAAYESFIRAIISSRDSGGNAIRTEVLRRGEQGNGIYNVAGNGGLSGARNYTDTPDSFFTTERTAGTGNILKDGADAQTGATQTGIPDGNLSIGMQGNTQANRMNATFNFISYGGSLPDYLAHYNNAQQLINDLS